MLLMMMQWCEQQVLDDEDGDVRRRGEMRAKVMAIGTMFKMFTTLRSVFRRESLIRALCSPNNSLAFSVRNRAASDRRVITRPGVATPQNVAEWLKKARHSQAGPITLESGRATSSSLPSLNATGLSVQ